jgi:nucleoside-diphosphate-sugar epimerase
MSVVLVTGATGFVGRQTLECLARDGIKTRVILRSPAPSWLSNVQGIEATIFSNDIFSETTLWWNENLAGVDTVVHIAWYAQPGKYLQSELNVDCLAGTLRLAQGCVDAGIRRFIGVGTCFEYDLRGSAPVGVMTPLQPLSLYAACKAAAFLTLSQIFAARQIEFAWCRLFYLHGQGEHTERLVPYLHQKMQSGQTAELSSGNQVRDFLDVKDAGRLIAEITESELQGAQNICSGIPITVRQLAESIADQYQRRDLLKFGMRPDNLVDPAYVVGLKE